VTILYLRATMRGSISLETTPDDMKPAEKFLRPLLKPPIKLPAEHEGLSLDELGKLYAPKPRVRVKHGRA
jgi:hypothetical protein